MRARLLKKGAGQAATWSGGETEARIVMDLPTERAEECTRSDRGTAGGAVRKEAGERMKNLQKLPLGINWECVGGAVGCTSPLGRSHLGRKEGLE